MKVALELPLDAIVVDRQVHAMAPLGVARLGYAMVYGDGIWLRELEADGGGLALRRRLCPAPKHLVGMAMTVVGGYGSTGAQVGSLGVAHALASSAALWQVFTIIKEGQPLDAVEGATSYEVTLAPGERGLGLVNQRGTNPPALVVQSADRKRLRLAMANSYSALFESAAPIERCAVCPISGKVAVLTRDRRLTVLDPIDRTALLVVTDDGLPGAEDTDDAH
jgi:hypothetical protein